METITISRLRKFRSCPRLHYLVYDLRLEPVVQREAARFGTLGHCGLEGWFRAWQAGIPPIDNALAWIDRKAREDEEIDEFEMQRASALLEGYHVRWNAEPLEVLGVEVEFKIPLVNPDTGARSRTYELAGKIDAIVRDQEGRVWIVEHKTTTLDITAGSDYWKRLRLDGQISVYLDGARALGYEPAGCLYDVLLRPGQRPLKATPEADRKFTKGKECKCGSHPGCMMCQGSGWKEAPRLHATQREVDETPQEFGDRIRLAIAEDPTRYYQRGTVVRLDDELVDARWDVWNSARTIRETQLAGRHVRNPGACVQFGTTCQFFDACTGVASLDDRNLFTVRESAHPELAASAKEELKNHADDSSNEAITLPF